MRFVLGLLLGYCIRGQKAIVLSRCPSVIAIICFIVPPVIACVPEFGLFASPPIPVSDRL
jgi:hypothetical protein